MSKVTLSAPTPPSFYQHRREVWQKRPALRDVYNDIFDRMMKHLPRNEYPRVLELGCGGGGLKDRYAHVLASELTPLPWSDLCASAYQIPFESNALDGIVMMDVLHHLKEPKRFFDEITRTLRKGGRLVFCEPHISWTGYLLYNHLHPEDVNLKADPRHPVQGPREENQAFASLLYWRRPQFQKELHPCLKVASRERFSFIQYPLSGGFDGKRFLPYSLFKFIKPLEQAMRPFAPLIALRSIIVLEKK